MNSTLVSNPTTLSMVQMMEKMKALEEMVARPQVQNLDTRQLGTQFARCVSENLKSHQGMKRSKSPDGAPEARIVEMLKAEGPMTTTRSSVGPCGGPTRIPMPSQKITGRMRSIHSKQPQTSTSNPKPLPDTSNATECVREGPWMVTFCQNSA
jgi:hypothetical protein